MSRKPIEVLPFPQFPMALRPEVAEKLKTRIGAMELAADLEVKRDESISSRVKYQLKRQIDCARAVAMIHGLREDAERAFESVEQDRNALQKATEAARNERVRLEAEYSAAQQSHNDVVDRIAKLQQGIKTQADEREERVKEAARAFDAAMAQADEAEQQRCAEALHQARTSAQLGEDAAQPTLLRVASLQAAEKRAAAVLADLAAKIDSTNSVIESSAFKLALIEYDARSLESMLSHIAAQVALARCSTRPTLFGFGEASFWVSTARHAIRTNNTLPKTPDGPVLTSGLALANLVAQAIQPDFSAFDVTAE